MRYSCTIVSATTPGQFRFSVVASKPPDHLLGRAILAEYRLGDFAPAAHLYDVAIAGPCAEIAMFYAALFHWKRRNDPAHAKLLLNQALVIDPAFQEARIQLEALLNFC